MVHGPLEGSTERTDTQNVSRHPQTSTEASFDSVSETLPLQITPEPGASRPKFGQRTSSDKGGQPFRKVKNNAQPTAPPARVITSSADVDAPTAGTPNHFGSKPDLQPLTLNPPTPRSTRSRPHQTRLKHSKWRMNSSPAVVENTNSIITKGETAVSRQKPELEPGDHVDIKERNAVAETLVAPSLRLPPLPSLGSDAPEDDFKDAAEISIARQISISHRQRELLVPIVPRVARQPMLVDVSDRSQVARKSHHLVLEDG